MGDAYAEHAPERLVNPAVAWGTLGAHVVTAKSDRGSNGGCNCSESPPSQVRLALAADGQIHPVLGRSYP